MRWFAKWIKRVEWTKRVDRPNFLLLGLHPLLLSQHKCAGLSVSMSFALDFCPTRA